MNFSQNLYDLRKKKGLSQEQLAEALQVSRQAVSKWESGTAMPESEKLIAISDFFGVSLDLLLKGEALGETFPSSLPKTENAGHLPWLLGLLAILCGLVGLIVWGVLLISGAADRIGASSAVTLDGNGLVLALSLLFLVIGSALLWRLAKKQKR